MKSCDSRELETYTVSRLNFTAYDPVLGEHLDFLMSLPTVNPVFLGSMISFTYIVIESLLKMRYKVDISF